MASKGSFPRAYVNDVPAEGQARNMEYVPFDKLDIGARSSGLPKGTMNGIKSLEHVGGSAGKGGK